MTKQRFKWAYILLGGALSWLAHLLLTYAIGEGACILDGNYFIFLGLTSSAWLLLLISIMLLLASLGSLLVATRQNSKEFPNVMTLRHLAIVANTIFLIAILAQSLPIFTLSEGC